MRLGETMSSPFEVLDVEPDADDETIEQAYRRKVKEVHPDAGGSAEAFQAVREAYERIQSGDVDLDTEVPTPEPEPAPAEDQRSRVEYLNFEVLDDHGWTIDDEDLFSKAADADLDPEDYGRFLVEPGEYLLEAAEERGFTWPFACRGGACANCAVHITEGELSMPVDHILSGEMTDRGTRLSCVGEPLTDELQVVYNIKHLPDLEDLRLPPGPFKRAKADD